MAFRVSVSEAAAKTMSSTLSPAASEEAASEEAAVEEAVLEAAAGGQGSSSADCADHGQKAAAGNEIGFHEFSPSIVVKIPSYMFTSRNRSRTTMLLAGALAVQTGGDADAVLEAG